MSENHGFCVIRLIPRDYAFPNTSAFSNAVRWSLDVLACDFGYEGALAHFMSPDHVPTLGYEQQLLYDEYGTDKRAIIPAEDLLITEDGESVYLGKIYPGAMEKRFAVAVAPRAEGALNFILSALGGPEAQITGNAPDEIAGILNAITNGNETPQTLEIVSKAIAEGMAEDAASKARVSRAYKFATRLRANIDEADKSPTEKLVEKLWEIQALLDAPLKEYIALPMPQDERVDAIHEFYEDTGLEPVIDALYRGIPVSDLGSARIKEQYKG